MDIHDVLKAQTAWLDKARAALTPDKSPAVDPAVSLDTTQKRAEIISQRVADLKLEKKRSGERYDAAIAELAGQLTGLQTALSQVKTLLQDAANSPEPSTTIPVAEAPSTDSGAKAPSTDAGTKAPPKQAIAALLRGNAAAAATPTKTASTKTPSKKAKRRARPSK